MSQYKSNSRNKSFPILYYIKIIFIINIINYCNSLCPKDSPFSKNGNCVINCTKEEIKSEKCLLDNEIIKIQWINNIIQVGPPNYHYISITITKNDDLIYMVSCFPSINIECNNIRYFFGLTKHGKGYFTNNDNPQYNKIELNDPNNTGRYESEIFPIKLEDSNLDDNEYLMSIAKSNQSIELYDLKESKVYFKNLITTFNLTNIHQEV